MNPDLVIICGPCTGKTTHVMEALALCRMAIAIATRRGIAALTANAAADSPPSALRP
jgi:hypothetical protein